MPEIFLRINNGHYEMGTTSGGTATVSAAVPSGDTGAWVHLAGCFDGSRWLLYRNGLLLAAVQDAKGRRALGSAGRWALGARPGRPRTASSKEP